MKINTSLIIEEIIENKIYLINGQKVMTDYDLAHLYEVDTKVLNQSVKRNIDRFPSDFMFLLDSKEEINLKSQFVTSNYGRRRYKVLVFTEQGIAMLSSVLKSDRAIQVNIQIIRIFTKLRQMTLNYKDLQEKLEKLESTHDENFKVVFDALRHIMTEEEKPKKQIGFEAVLE